MEYIAHLHKDRNSDYDVSFPDFPGCISAGKTLASRMAAGRWRSISRAWLVAVCSPRFPRSPCGPRWLYTRRQFGTLQTPASNRQPIGYSSNRAV
jgi:hypothetical protein